MTNPETATPNEARGDPDHQGAGEIDLTGLTQRPEQLTEVINDAFVEAEATGGELPEWGARAVAQSLADRSDAPTPALHEFALTGKGNLETVSIEAMPIYNQPGCPPSIRKQIDYLLTFVLNRPEQGGAHSGAPADQAQETTADLDYAELPPLAAEGIKEYGDAFRAFLRLPDIKPDDESLIDNYHEWFVGKFYGIDELLAALTEIESWEAQVNQLAERLGIIGFVTLDRDGIEAHVRDTWDVVEHNGALYVFDK